MTLKMLSDGPKNEDFIREQIYKNSLFIAMDCEYKSKYLEISRMSSHADTHTMEHSRTSLSDQTSGMCH